MDMNLQKYLAFVKTVEFGSFTKAAEALSCSQSGISRMIHDLETEWGLSLMERGRAGVRLTADGKVLLPHAQQLCASCEALEVEAARLRGLESGTVRIAAAPAAATHWLPNILREFQRDCPDLRYELLHGDTNTVERWLLEGSADCGFLHLPAHPDLDTVFLEQSQLLFAQYGTPEVLLETSDVQAILSMAEAGLGVSILPALLLENLPYRICAKSLETPAYQRFGLALRDRKAASAATRKFLDYLPYRTQREGPRRLAPPPL